MWSIVRVPAPVPPGKSRVHMLTCSQWMERNGEVGRSQTYLGQGCNLPPSRSVTTSEYVCVFDDGRSPAYRYFISRFEGAPAVMHYATERAQERIRLRRRRVTTYTKPHRAVTGFEPAISSLANPLGFEPRYADRQSAVLDRTRRWTQKTAFYAGIPAPEQKVRQ